MIIIYYSIISVHNHICITHKFIWCKRKKAVATLSPVTHSYYMFLKEMSHFNHCILLPVTKVWFIQYYMFICNPSLVLRNGVLKTKVIWTAVVSTWTVRTHRVTLVLCALLWRFFGCCFWNWQYDCSNPPLSDRDICRGPPKRHTRTVEGLRKC